MRLFSKRPMKIAAIILLLTITFYIFHLNSLVKDKFSKPLAPSKNVNQIEYSIDDYPIDLINMLLLVEDQSFFITMELTLKRLLEFFMDTYSRTKH